jgi:hypothetical protein
MAPAARDLKFYRAFTELFYLVDPVDPVRLYFVDWCGI